MSVPWRKEKEQEKAAGTWSNIGRMRVASRGRPLWTGSNRAELVRWEHGKVEARPTWNGSTVTWKETSGQRLLVEGTQFWEWAARRRSCKGRAAPTTAETAVLSLPEVSPPRLDQGIHREDQGRRFRKLSDRLPLSLDMLSRMLPFPGGSFVKAAKSGRSPEVSVWRDWRMQSEECLSCSLGRGSPNKPMVCFFFFFFLVCFLQYQRKVPSTTGYKQDALPSSYSHSWRTGNFELYLKIHHMLGDSSWGWGRVV